MSINASKEIINWFRSNEDTIQDLGLLAKASIEKDGAEKPQENDLYIPLDLNGDGEIDPSTEGFYVDKKIAAEYFSKKALALRTSNNKVNSQVNKSILVELGVIEKDGISVAPNNIVRIAGESGQSHIQEVAPIIHENTKIDGRSISDAKQKSSTLPSVSYSLFSQEPENNSIKEGKIKDFSKEIETKWNELLKQTTLTTNEKKQRIKELKSLIQQLEQYIEENIKTNKRGNLTLALTELKTSIEKYEESINLTKDKVMSLIDFATNETEQIIKSNEVNSWNPFDHLANRTTGDNWWNPLNHNETSSGSGKLNAHLRELVRKLEDTKSKLKEGKIDEKQSLKEFGKIVRNSNTASIESAESVAEQAIVGAKVSAAVVALSVISSGGVAAAIEAPVILGAAATYVGTTAIAGTPIWAPLATSTLTGLGLGAVGGGTGVIVNTTTKGVGSLAYNNQTKAIHKEVFGKEAGVTLENTLEAAKDGSIAGITAGANVLGAAKLIQAGYSAPFAATVSGVSIGSIHSLPIWFDPNKSFSQKALATGANIFGNGAAGLIGVKLPVNSVFSKNFVIQGFSQAGLATGIAYATDGKIKPESIPQIASGVLFSGVGGKVSHNQELNGMQDFGHPSVVNKVIHSMLSKADKSSFKPIEELIGAIRKNTSKANTVEEQNKVIFDLDKLSDSLREAGTSWNQKPWQFRHIWMQYILINQTSRRILGKKIEESIQSDRKFFENVNLTDAEKAIVQPMLEIVEKIRKGLMKVETPKTNRNYPQDLDQLIQDLTSLNSMIDKAIEAPEFSSSENFRNCVARIAFSEDVLQHLREGVTKKNEMDITDNVDKLNENIQKEWKNRIDKAKTIAELKVEEEELTRLILNVNIEKAKINAAAERQEFGGASTELIKPLDNFLLSLDKVSQRILEKKISIKIDEAKQLIKDKAFNEEKVRELRDFVKEVEASPYFITSQWLEVAVSRAKELLSESVHSISDPTKSAKPNDLISESDYSINDPDRSPKPNDFERPQLQGHQI